LGRHIITLLLWNWDVGSTLENRSMAGVAVEQDSIHMNIQIQLSYANLKLQLLLGYVCDSNFKERNRICQSYKNNTRLYGSWIAFG
jgi:hypothetical protein